MHLDWEYFFPSNLCIDWFYTHIQCTDISYERGLLFTNRYDFGIQEGFVKIKYSFGLYGQQTNFIKEGGITPSDGLNRNWVNIIFALKQAMKDYEHHFITVCLPYNLPYNL